jgi:hypothetical protein
MRHFRFLFLVIFVLVIFVLFPARAATGMQTRLYVLTKSGKKFLAHFGGGRNRKTPTQTTIGKSLYFGSHHFVGQFGLRNR